MSVIDTASNAVIKTIEVGLHPCGMALSPTGDRLYVTNANSDTVSVIDTATDTVTEDAARRSGWQGRDRPVLGSSPNAITVSPDGRTLYVANAVTECRRRRRRGQEQHERGSDKRMGETGLAGGTRREEGFIPTRLVSRRRSLWTPAVSSCSLPAATDSDPWPRPRRHETGRSYADRKGVISILDVPDRGELAEFTKQVLRQNNRTLPPGGVDEPGRRHPIPRHVGQRFSDQARVLHHQGKSHLRSGVRRLCHRATETRRWCSSAETCRRTTMPSSSNSCCSTTTTALAISPPWAIAGFCRRIQAHGRTSTGMRGTTRTRCCSARPKPSTTTPRRTA